MYMLTNPFACSRVELFAPDTSNTTCSSTVWHHTPPGTVWGSVYTSNSILRWRRRNAITDFSKVQTSKQDAVTNSVN